MRKILSAIVLCLIVKVSVSQQTSVQKLEKIRLWDSLLMRGNTDVGQLVSNYTFRNLLKNDFAMLLTGDKSKTSTGRYAALDLNSTEKRFTISPFVYNPGNDPLVADFRHIFNIDFTGTLYNNNSFNFKDRNTVTVGFNYTYVTAGYDFITKSPELTNDLNSLYDAVSSDFIAKINALNPVAGSAAPPIKDKVDGLYLVSGGSDKEMEKAYFEKIRGYEEKLTSKSWTGKKIRWFKLGFNLISNDKFNYIDTTNIVNYLSPKIKVVFNPSIQASYNYYHKTRKGIDLYANAWVKYSRKHSLSEIASSKQWNQINKLSGSDSIYFGVESKDVYLVNENKFASLNIGDWGFQCIALKNFRDLIDIGLDLKYENVGFIKPLSENSISKIETITFGIIFPMKDKDGASTVIFEPFFQHRQYVDYDKASQNLWGIRFSLPFKNVL